jgi:glycosyltransferase involved in cell wall biosynthesis
MNGPLPSVSFIVITRNSGKNLRICLKRVAAQDYPRSKVELVIVDCGSTDDTIGIAKKYIRRLGGRIVVRKDYWNDQEARRAVGLHSSKNEIAAYIDSDNFIPTRDWLRQMVFPFMDNPEIVASQTLRYCYWKRSSLLNRYFGLFGFNDPVAFYMGKADRLAWYHDDWRLSGKATDCGSYYLVEFDTENLPTVGCNGFLVRRKELLAHADTRPEAFFHIDVNYDLVKNGRNKFAFVKNCIFHRTAGDLLSFLRKRAAYAKEFDSVAGYESKRRYRIFDPKKGDDVLRLLIYILYSVTIVKPLYDSIRGYAKKPDLAWFLHPFMCLSFLCIYGFYSLRAKVVPKGG